ncbi:hypothetical protein HAX54_039359 [Datura stramonium]|uniref:Uncharacterized protein n=1 Tax=Datura stramonium TaxID=4076 RepID=A0ABS8SJ81_DATST|nr:hypothetical protein [Datura stramonium]
MLGPYITVFEHPLLLRCMNIRTSKGWSNSGKKELFGRRSHMVFLSRSRKFSDGSRWKRRFQGGKWVESSERWWKEAVHMMEKMTVLLRSSDLEELGDEAEHKFLDGVLMAVLWWSCVVV